MPGKIKVIIAGGRDIEWYDVGRLMENAMHNIKFSLEDIEEIVTGKAHGMDSLGELWAIENNIPIRGFPANWQEYGRAAGPIRNRKMAVYVGPSGRLVCVWDGKSRGTKNMIEEARMLNIPTWVERI